MRGYIYVTQMLLMKSFLTLVLVLFFGTVVTAQNIINNDKVDILKMDIVLVIGDDANGAFEKVPVRSEKSVARLYRYKNSRVKKELTFSTKKSRPKLA